MTRRRASFTGPKTRKPMLIAGILFLLLIPAALIAARRPNKASAAWFDTNWAYRTKVDIANSSGSTQTDFQVSVATDTATLITAGKMQATCGDLRVTDNAGKLLNYWVEPNTCNTSSTQIWVKVPSIPTSGIPIYLYYGNTSATPATYKTTDVFIKEISGSLASWPMDDTVTTQSYARVLNPSAASGRNIVINGTFNADVSWTKQTGWTIANGVAHHDGSGSSARSIYQTTPVVAGKYYSFTYTISNIQAGGSFAAYIQGVYGTNRTTNGTFTETILAGSTNTNTNIVQQGSGAADIDNISVTQVDVPSSGSTTNIITDGDMETSGVATWNTGGTDSVITKVSASPHSGTQNLRVAFGSTFANPLASKSVVVGKTYRVYGWYRGDGTHTPRIDDNNTPLSTGTTSTTWQPFDFIYTAVTSSLRFRAITGVAGYAEFDDITVAEDNFTRPGELVADGNMEGADTSLWTPINSATLTKSTASPHGGSNAIRVTYNAVSFPRAEQILLIIGKTYHATGWFRGDGTYAPLFRTDTANKVLGTTSTTWQNFEITFVADGTKVWLSSMATTAGWVEYDDVSVTEVSPMVGTFDATATKKPTLGSASGGHLSTAYSFNAANSQYVNAYSSDLNSAFNPSEGTMIAWAKVSGAGVWTDGANREIFRLSDGGSNLLDMEKGVSGNNTIVYRAYFGGTNLAVAVGSLSSTGWFQVALTWSKSANQMKAYYNGSQTGSTQTGLGTWSANITNAQTIIGAATNTGSEPWSGLINDVHLFNRALSSDEIASLYSSSSDIQAYATNNYLGKELVRKYNSGITTTPSYTEENSLGPAAYWKFDEGSGTQAKDSSSNNNTGSITAGSWQTEDQCVSGKCLQFNGTSSFVNGGSSNIINLSGNFTVSNWFKTSDVGGTQIMTSKGTTNDWLFSLRKHTDDKLYCKLYQTNSSSTYLFAESSMTINDGKWHYGTCVVSGSTISVYVDGVLAGSSSSVTGTRDTSSSGNFFIGKLDNSSPTFYSGFIDEVKVYPYALTAAQIQTDYNSRGSNTAAGTNIGLQNNTFLNNGLVAYWKMDEATWSGSANEVVDSSGNGVAGTAYGATNGKAYPTTGKFGNAAYFDGVDDRITLTNATGLQIASKTVSFWANPTVSRDEILFANGSSNYYMRFVGTTMYFSYANAAGSQLTVQQNNAVIIGSWHYYTYTIDVSGNNVAIKMYVDGVRVDSIAPRTDGYWSSYGASYIIGGISVANYAYVGYIDDLRVYNRVLSPSEISQLYNWAPGPVAYYPLDEGNTGTANDTSGGNNNSSAESTTSITTGKYGKARNFLGTGAGITIADADGKNDFNYNQDFTVSAWIKNPSTQVNTSSTANSIIEKWSSGTAYPYVIRLNNQTSGSPGKYAVARYDTTHNPSITSTNAYNDNLWHYVTFQKYGANIYLYIDGKQDGNGVTDTTNVTTLNASPLYLGSRNGGSFPWQGALDDIKIYNYARTQQQIIEDMNGGHPTGGSPVGSQISYWKLDEGFGQTVNNTITGGPNGTLGTTSGADATDPTWKTSADCKNNSCLSFDGSNDYVSLGNNIFTNANLSQGSVSSWFYASANNRDQMIFNFEGMVWLGRLASHSNNLALNTYDGSAHYVDFTGDIPTGAWHQAIVTWDGVTTKLYIDGKYINGVASGSPVFDSFSRGNNIGITYDGTSYPFQGRIDDVKVYSSALTADQVKIDYNAGASLNFGVGAASESAQLSDGADNPPVAYWDFEERSGTTANDKSGNNFTGTLTCTGGGCQNPTWTNGKVGSSLQFNGTSNYVNMNNNSSSNALKPTLPITVSAWVKYTNTATVQTIIATDEFDNTNYAGVSFQIQPAGQLALQYGDNLGGNSSARRRSATGTTVLASGRWYHVTGVIRAATDMSIYINGQSDTVSYSGTGGTLAYSNVPTRIGFNGAYYFNGQIDEVKVYNYAKTLAQVAYDYNRGMPVGWWQFDECQGSTLHDASGNALDGLLTIGGSGTQTSIGSCTTPGSAWSNGASGKFNSGISFDGSDDKVKVTNNALLNFDYNQDFTVSTWIKIPAVTVGASSAGRIIDKSPGTAYPYLMWIYRETHGTYPGKVLVARYDGTHNPNIISTHALNDNIWHLVTFSKKGSLLYLYIDGTLDQNPVSDITNTTTTNSNDLYFGMFADGVNNPLTGSMDDVRIYNYALSATQVKSLFNGGAAVKYGPASGQP